MISWASKKLLNAGLVVALLATFTSVGFLNAPVSADALTGKNNDGLASQTERWLRLRAITKCFNDNDIGKNSYNDVEKGAIFDSGGVAIGYLNEDGKVSCDGDAGESFVRNSFGIIGFASPVEAFCSVQPMASRGGSDSRTESNFEGCTTGSGNEFDMDSDAFSQGARQVEQFRKGYQEHAQSPVSWSPPAAMMYHVYKSSLLEFCGAKLIGPYDSADENNINADQRKVVVNDIDLGTGEIVRNVYSLTLDQGDTVDDIYVNGDMQNVSNVSCSDMAKKTWDYDNDMATYVKAYNTANPDDVPESGTIGGTNPGSGSNEPVCSAGALGWIICPAINFIASFNDMAYAAIQNMLIIEPTTVKIGGPLYNTWTKFRDIANVLFVIAFFVVIFSQATSVGLSSYGIKKLLPRVIAAAILVNLSFFICQIALDITNIVGVSIANLFEAMHSGSNVDVNVLSWQTAIGALLAGGAAYGGVVAVLGAGGVVGAMAAILPFLVTALFAVVTAVAILIARQVIIILLIALAPLAFVAFILPNTQKYFQLWQNTFTTMLVMFPLIAALFAGSQLAANIVLTSNTTSDGIDFFQLIAAVCILFIPLFGVPYIVKFSGGAIGRLAGVINNPSKGPFDKVRKKAEGYRDHKQNQAAIRNQSGGGNGLQRNTFGRYQRRRARVDAERTKVSQFADDAKSGYIAEASLKDQKLAQDMAGGKYQGANLSAAVRQVQAVGIAHEREESRKRVGAIQQRLMHDRTAIEKYKENDAEVLSGRATAGQLRFDTGMGKVYADAAAANDYETMSAVINETHKQGAFGRQAAVDMVTTQAIQDDVARYEVEQTVYGLSSPGRSDLVKGSMDSATKSFKLKSVSALPTEQKASLDGDVLQKAIRENQVTQAEAQRIVTTPGLVQKVDNAGLVRQLEAIARGGEGSFTTPQGPNPASTGGVTPPPTSGPTPPTTGSTGTGPGPTPPSPPSPGGGTP